MVFDVLVPVFLVWDKLLTLGISTHKQLRVSTNSKFPQQLITHRRNFPDKIYIVFTCAQRPNSAKLAGRVRPVWLNKRAKGFVKKLKPSVM